MQTVTYSRFGSPDVLTLSDAAPTSPRSGHLVVRVHAVSINPLGSKIRRGDARLLSGTKFPKTPGLDFAGGVEQVGEGVSDFQVGDVVFGGPGSWKAGYLSERISDPARVVAKKPKSLELQARSHHRVGKDLRLGARVLRGVGRSTQESCVLAPPACSRSPSTGAPSRSRRRAAWSARSSSGGRPEQPSRSLTPAPVVPIPRPAAAPRPRA